MMKGVDKSILIENVRSKSHIVERFLGFKDRPAPKVINKKIAQQMETFPGLLDIFYNYKIEADVLNLIYSVGPKFEEGVEKLINSGQAMNGMILDKIGVLCLDELRSLIIEEIKDSYGKTPSKFYYPGTKDYGMDLQEEIYKLVPETGYIKINSYKQLYPIKTVALRADLKDGVSDLKLSPCDSCDFSCPMRGGYDE